MISIYQFSGMMQNLTDHVALSITGHPGTQLVIEELSDCIHTSFYFDNEELRNKLISHQEKLKPACSMCSNENRLKRREPNNNLIEKLYCPNPAGAFALRRYRGEGNNRISNDKNLLVASTAATNNAFNSGNFSAQYSQLWKNVDNLSRIKWEVNILTREDLTEYFGDSLPAVNLKLFPSEQSIINALKAILNEKQDALGDCADTVLKVLNMAKIPVNCYLTRAGSLMGSCANIASSQSDILQKNKSINALEIRRFCLQNYSLSACMNMFLSNKAYNESQINEYKSSTKTPNTDLSCHLPTMDDWLFKLYGDLRGIHLVGINGYRQIINLEHFKFYISGRLDQEPFKQNLTTRLAAIGVSLP